MAETVLKMEHIVQTFPGVRALDDVFFELEKGEVHALLGENGAGKSTLVKVLTGVNKPDKGSIELFGKSYNALDIAQAKKLGVSMIYQELQLIPYLNVSENIYLGKEPKRGGFVDRKKMRRDTEKLLDRLGVKLDPSAVINELNMASRQIVEIAKAISDNAQILIMDEPTAPLANDEVKKLFDMIRLLKAEGVSIIYISHRLGEVFEVCDRCTVYRDGKFIKTMRVGDTDEAELIHTMVGRKLTNKYPPRIAVDQDAPVMLEANNITTDKLNSVSISVKKGEILGVGGLVGSGRTELLRAIFGCDVYTGSIYKNGSEITVKTPKDAIKHRIVLATEDRKGQGLLLNLTVSDNIAMPSLGALKKGVFLDKGKISQAAKLYIDKLSIKTPSEKQIMGNLSGGNQQKVVISKWMLLDADVIMFDEPTRGIDVGARYEIYQLMNELKLIGKSIIMVSSDMPELLGMSDRIVVMCEGRLNGELKRIEDFSQERVLKIASNV